MSYDLSPEEVRVLGALIEKETTTPDYYPLTLNGLLNACNQKSNRDPVVSYDESAAHGGLDRLRDRQWAFRVELMDSRVPKYEHSFGKQTGLTVQETAVMCVLMLRGPQTVGEIRGRTGRLYPFEDMNEVEIALESLMEREEPMVMRLPVQPGRKEARYAHLLSGEVEVADEPAVVYAPPPSQSQAPAPVAADDGRLDELELEVAQLKEDLAALQQAFATFKSQFE